MKNSKNLDLIIKDALILTFEKPFSFKKLLLAIKDGHIVEIAPAISDNHCSKVIDGSGLYLTPGLIDNPTHCYYTNWCYSSLGW